MKNSIVLFLFLIIVFTHSFCLSDLITVSSGIFNMGNTRNDIEGFNNEKPVHEVRITYDYYISKFETTNEQYAEFLNSVSVGKDGIYGNKMLIDIKDTECELEIRNGVFNFPLNKGQNPILEITWWGAIEYCNWLSDCEGLLRAYDENGNLLDKNGNKTNDITEVEGYRLPTEAEWEYMARGGHNMQQDYKYSGSDSINEVAVYWNNSANQTKPVGSKKTNDLGIFDVTGNVWEWCHDLYSKYENRIYDNPIGADNGNERVIRGGSWDSLAKFCRIPRRVSGKPGSSGMNIGFRIVKTDTDGSESKLSFNIGDYVQFGKYFDEPILWKVINIDENENPMLWSYHILTVKPFDSRGNYHTDEVRKKYGSNEWEFSNIRQWLNSYNKKIEWWQNSPSAENLLQGYNPYDKEEGFLSAFNFKDYETDLIKPVIHKVLLPYLNIDEKDGGNFFHLWVYEIEGLVQNYDNAFYKMIEDKVFLLSAKELHDYVYKNGMEYRAKPTKKAIMNSTDKNPDFKTENFWYSWLRTPGAQSTSNPKIKVNKSNGVRYVSPGGGINSAYASDFCIGIQPALYLKNDSVFSLTGKGTEKDPYIINYKGE